MQRNSSPWAAARHVLVLHAHPDDETIATGGALADMAAGGAVTLVTATRGELGEVVPGALAHLQGSDRLASHRVGELRRALERLGVVRHEFLGSGAARQPGLAQRVYRDSGMQWGPDGLAVPLGDAAAGSFCAADFTEVCADLRAVAVHSGADLVVSYDPTGGYGHPDHVRCHRAAAWLATELRIPFVQIVPLDHQGVIRESDRENTAAGELVVFALGAQHRAAKWAALRAHQSQFSVHGDTLLHSGGQRHVLGAEELFRVPGEGVGALS